MLLPPSQLWRLHTFSKHKQCPRHPLQLSWSLRKSSQTELWLLPWWLGWAVGASSAEQFIILIRTMCFKGRVWAHNHTDIQFISWHWMSLKDERLKWILSTDKVSFILSWKVYGWVYYVITNVIIFQKTKEKWDRRLCGIMSRRNVIQFEAVTLFHSF